ncbi:MULTISPECIES: hypothetical protein [Streptomyces]|uniref:hypothetical protein n=1 Tax=Streptomyces TaxID=1883 RepID=UPI001E64669D|nr:hypothetical protein [Streptomyces sp. 14R-10]
MSRTHHHRRHKTASPGNPARLLGFDDRAAARKGILKTAARDEDGNPDFTGAAASRAQTQDKPGTRKAFQSIAHGRDRAAVRAALSTTAYRRDPASRQALRMERALPPIAATRRIDWDIS